MAAPFARLSVALVAAWVVAGCDYEPIASRTELPTRVTPPTDGPPTDTPPDVDDPVIPPEDKPKPVVVDPIGVVTSAEEEVVVIAPPPIPEAPTRPRRRMDIDQLDRAIQQVTGGLAWTEVDRGEDVNQFVVLAQTLGKPDYISATQEDLDPSPLFQKFLDEAARTVCTRLADAEVYGVSEVPILMGQVDLTDTLASAPEAIDDNLRALLLRFHGKALAPSSPQLARWRWLFQSAHHVTSDPIAAWRTVCTGLIMHPDFYTY